MDLYEVVVTAPEPWSAGIRAAFNAAILEFVESDLGEDECASDDFDADAQLRSWVESYVGMGGNAHPDASGPVFTDGRDAQMLADTLREHLDGLASVRLYRLDGGEEGEEEE